jgi:predicted  nucleic acid-binding Zn-ribbon protein
MKAEAAQQRSLIELTELDADIGRLDHRAKKLAEQERLDALTAEHREAGDKLATLQIALEDLDGEVAKFESEVESVRKRADRDQSMLDAGNVNAKQLTELQHEMETLQRRQSSLEDDLLEVMQRREELQDEEAAQKRAIGDLQGIVNEAQVARDQALAEIDAARQTMMLRRTELASVLNADLVAIYERQRALGNPGAGLLQGRRCGACRIEIDRADMSRFAAAAEDDVLRCPECGAILLRQQGSVQ